MTCPIDVLGEKVVAREIPKEKKEGILIVPDEKRTESIVEVIGINELTPEKIIVGSKIMIKSNWMQKVKHNDQEMLIIPLSEILGVVK